MDFRTTLLFVCFYMVNAQPRVLLLRSRNLAAVPTTECRRCQSVDLSENYLRHVTQNSFSVYPAVKYLYLRENVINQVDPGAFSNLTHLLLLDLSGNQITHIKATTRFPSTLRRLLLSRNPLIAATFVSDSLTSLDLSYCQFRVLSLDVFAGLPKLESLDLNHNALRSLDVMVVEALTRIKDVSLEENPWHCDCVMNNLTSKTEENEEMSCVTEMGDVIPWSQLRCVNSTFVVMATREKTTANVVLVDLGNRQAPDLSDHEQIEVSIFPDLDKAEVWNFPDLDKAEVSNFPDLDKAEVSNFPDLDKAEVWNFLDLDKAEVSNFPDLGSAEVTHIPKPNEENDNEMALNVVMYSLCGAMVLILMVLVAVTTCFLWPSLILRTQRTTRRRNVAWQTDEDSYAET